MSTDILKPADSAPTTDVPKTEPVEETPAVAAPATEEAAAPAVTESAAEPVTEPAAETEAVPAGLPSGLLAFKTKNPVSLAKLLGDNKKWFWFQEEAVGDAALSLYIHEHPRDKAIAWSSTTGKGLLYFARSEEGKAAPQGIFVLSDVKDLTSTGDKTFSFHYDDHKYDLKASSAAEKDKWVAAIEAEAAKAVEAESTITEEPAYVEALQKRKDLEGVVAAAAVEREVAESSAAAAKTPDEKKRSSSKRRASYFGFGKDKKEKEEEKKEEEAVAAPVIDTAVTEPETEAKAEEPVAPAAEPVSPTVKEETATTPKNKRNSFFGAIPFLNKDKKVTSPSEEKKEEVVAPATTEETPAVVEPPTAPVAAPITSEPVVDAPLDSEDSKTKEAAAAAVGTTAAVGAIAAAEAKKEPEAEKAASPPKEGFFAKVKKTLQAEREENRQKGKTIIEKTKEKKAAKTDKSAAAAPVVTAAAVKEAAEEVQKPEAEAAAATEAESAPITETAEAGVEPVVAPAVATDALTSEDAAAATTAAPAAATEPAPAGPTPKESRRTSVFGAFTGRNKKAGEVTSESEGEEKSTGSKLGNLLRRPSQLVKNRKVSPSKAAATPAPVEEAKDVKEPAPVTETAPATEEKTIDPLPVAEPEEPIVNNAISDVVPAAVTVGKPEVSASA